MISQYEYAIVADHFIGVLTMRECALWRGAFIGVLDFLTLVLIMVGFEPNSLPMESL